MSEFLMDKLGYTTFYHRTYRVPRVFFNYNGGFVEYAYYPEKTRFRNLDRATLQVLRRRSNKIEAL